MKTPAVLRLAIDDVEYGPEIRKTRVTTPDERSNAHRLDTVRRKMEEAKALDKATDRGRKNHAKLELATDDISVLLELEKSWLSNEERFAFGEWTHDEDYIVHNEAVAITRFLIANYRTDLRTYRIAVITQKEIPPSNGRGRLGTAMKLPGKIRFLSEFHAVVTLDFTHWRMLTDKDRQRLIHHELAHLEEGDQGLTIRHHDFEDFGTVVELYGLRSESEKFSTDGRSADVLERWSSQLELMDA